MKTNHTDNQNPPAAAAAPAGGTYFEDLDLSDNILDALWDMRFELCTPIQEACIPLILKGHDIIGVAQTGTGKTAAYLLPVLSLLDEGHYPEDAINCVVMSPTRELAQQIDQAMQGFGYYLPTVSSVAVYGGNDGNRFDTEVRALRTGADVVIATPGRLISHMQIGNLDLSQVSFFILDEADRMLDMGFSEDIMAIAKGLPANCQTIMFSATMPPKIEELAKTLLKRPKMVKLAVSKPAEKIKQSAYVCHDAQKQAIVKKLFLAERLKRVIVFCGKKQRVKEISRQFRGMNINSGEMHSDLTQAERDEVMFRFKSGQIDVLVATDIVARGIDIDDIAMVVNYDVPRDVEDYIHRIGRTARAERDGLAVTLVSEGDICYFKQIERFLDREIEKNALPDGLAPGPDYNAGGGKRPSNRKRSSNRKAQKGKARSAKKAQKKAAPKPQREQPKAAKPEKPAAEQQPKAAKPEKPAAGQQPKAASSEQVAAEGKKKSRKRRRPAKKKNSEQ